MPAPLVWCSSATAEVAYALSCASIVLQESLSLAREHAPLPSSASSAYN
jgi:hypothetical protein